MPAPAQPSPALPSLTPPILTPLILSIDAGSSSTRAQVFDARGHAVPSLGASEQHTLRTGQDGAVEDDPEAAVARIARCLDRVLAQAGPLAGAIGGVAVDTYVSNLLAVDAAGRPLTPVFTYADTRNDADATALQAVLDEHAVHERTGCLLRTSYWPARLAWLRRVRPDVWQQAARWLTLGEYLEWRLFGRCRVSVSAASWSGLLDRRTLTWDAPLLAHLGVDPAQLSPLVDVDEPLAGLGATWAARWPALRAVPWFPAVGDGAAANLGSGCVDASALALTLGTTGALRVVLPAPVQAEPVQPEPVQPEPVQPDVAQVPQGLWCYRVDRRQALVGGATSEGGNVYGWLSSTLRLGDPAAVAAAVAALPPDGHGLTVLPFVAGERSPDWAGNVQATLHGLTLATTPVGILRAGMEAVAYRFAVIERRLAGQAGAGQAGAGQRLVASGSALLNSPAWRQIFCDVLGRPLAVSAEPEATSRGAALLALRSLGVVRDLAELPAAVGAVHEPDAQRHAVYAAAIARQQALYDRVIQSAKRSSAQGSPSMW